jgi:hypothetical protein
MKRVLILVSIVFSMLIITCSNNETPTQVARNFITAVQKGNKKAAEQLLAPQFLKELNEIGWDEEFEDMKDYFVEMGKIISITERQERGMAYITVTFEDEEIELELMKVDDRWRITDI